MYLRLQAATRSLLQFGAASLLLSLLTGGCYGLTASCSVPRSVISSRCFGLMIQPNRYGNTHSNLLQIEEQLVAGKKWAIKQWSVWMTLEFWPELSSCVTMNEERFFTFVGGIRQLPDVFDWGVVINVKAAQRVCYPVQHFAARG